MGTGNKRWEQFLVLIVLICSFFYFILQVDIEEDLQANLQADSEVDPENGLQDKLSKSKEIRKSFPKSFMNPVTYMKQTNFFQGLLPTQNMNQFSHSRVRYKISEMNLESRLRPKVF